MGGPCDCNSKGVIGTVIALDGPAVGFEDSDGQTFWMDLPDVRKDLRPAYTFAS